MIGAYIGDMVAWTYERKPEDFEKYLVSDKAMPSGYMFNVTCAADLFLKLREWVEFDQDYYQAYFTNDDALSVLLQAIAAAWIFHSDGVTQLVVRNYLVYHDQDEQTCASLLAKVIYAIRNLATKNEAMLLEYNGKTIKEYIEFEKDNDSLCGCFARAWNIFEKADDFVEAVKKSMTLPGDRHFNAIMVGAIADSMYGCTYCHPKDDGCVNCYPITWGKLQMCISEKILKAYKDMKKFQGKNDVPIQLPKGWRSGSVPLEKIRFTERQLTELLKAYPFFYENGWVNVYDKYAICRFSLRKVGEYIFELDEYQINLNEASVVAEQDFKKVFEYAVKPYWKNESGEQRLERQLQDEGYSDMPF